MSKKVFVDSNIFLNFLLKEEQSYAGSKQLLERIEKGEIEGITTLVNIMEILAILRKKSSMKDDEIVRDVEKLGEVHNLEIIIPGEIHIAQAFEIQKKSKLMPADSIIVSIAKEFADVLVSRDKELQKKASSFVPVVEPENL